IYLIKYTAPDDSSRTGCVSSLAASREIFLRAAGASAVVGRRPRALAGPVPRAALDRARPAAADGPARRHAVLRRVERHGTGRPARDSRPGPAPRLTRRPPRESAPAHASRFADPGATAAADDGAIASAVQALARSAASASENPGDARRREVDLMAATGGP